MKCEACGKDNLDYDKLEKVDQFTCAFCGITYSPRSMQPIDRKVLERGDAVLRKIIEERKQVEAFEAAKEFHWQAMCKFGPDGHCDGSNAILYGVLKIMGYDVPFEDQYVSKDEVDKLISEVMEH